MVLAFITAVFHEPNRVQGTPNNFNRLINQHFLIVNLGTKNNLLQLIGNRADRERVWRESGRTYTNIAAGFKLRPL